MSIMQVGLKVEECGTHLHEHLGYANTVLVAQDTAMTKADVDCPPDLTCGAGASRGGGRVISVTRETVTYSIGNERLGSRERCQYVVGLVYVWVC